MIKFVIKQIVKKYKTNKIKQNKMKISNKKIEIVLHKLRI